MTKDSRSNKNIKTTQAEKDLIYLMKDLGFEKEDVLGALIILNSPECIKNCLNTCHSRASAQQKKILSLIVCQYCEQMLKDIRSCRPTFLFVIQTIQPTNSYKGIAIK